MALKWTTGSHRIHRFWKLLPYSIYRVITESHKLLKSLFVNESCMYSVSQCIVVHDVQAVYQMSSVSSKLRKPLQWEHNISLLLRCRGVCV